MPCSSYSLFVWLPTVCLYMPAEPVPSVICVLPTPWYLLLCLLLTSSHKLLPFFFFLAPWLGITPAGCSRHGTDLCRNVAVVPPPVPVADGLLLLLPTAAFLPWVSSLQFFTAGASLLTHAVTSSPRAFLPSGDGQVRRCLFPYLPLPSACLVHCNLLPAKEGSVAEKLHTVPRACWAGCIRGVLCCSLCFSLSLALFSPQRLYLRPLRLNMQANATRARAFLARLPA